MNQNAVNPHRSTVGMVKALGTTHPSASPAHLLTPTPCWRPTATRTPRPTAGTCRGAQRLGISSEADCSGQPSSCQHSGRPKTCARATTTSGRMMNSSSSKCKRLSTTRMMPGVAWVRPFPAHLILFTSGDRVAHALAPFDSIAHPTLSTCARAACFGPAPGLTFRIDIIARPPHRARVSLSR